MINGHKIDKHEGVNGVVTMQIDDKIDFQKKCKQQELKEGVLRFLEFF